jgi:hypothetical protein
MRKRCIHIILHSAHNNFLFFQALISRIISEPWRKWRLRRSQDTSCAFAVVITDCVKLTGMTKWPSAIWRSYKISEKSVVCERSWIGHTHTLTHTHSVVVTGHFSLRKGRRIKTQCIIHVWCINDLGPDHRVRNVLKLLSHSRVLPFTFFFPLLFSVSS